MKSTKKKIIVGAAALTIFTSGALTGFAAVAALYSDSTTTAQNVWGKMNALARTLTDKDTALQKAIADKTKAEADLSKAQSDLAAAQAAARTSTSQAAAAATQAQADQAAAVQTATDKAKADAGALGAAVAKAKDDQLKAIDEQLDKLLQTTGASYDSSIDGVRSSTTGNVKPEADKLDKANNAQSSAVTAANK